MNLFMNSEKINNIPVLGYRRGEQMLEQSIDEQKKTERNVELKLICVLLSQTAVKF